MTYFFKTNSLFFLTIFFSLLLCRIIGIAVVETLLLFLIISFLIKNKFNFYIDRKLFFFILFSIYISFNHLLQFNDFKKSYFEFSSLFHIRYFFIIIITTFFVEQFLKKKNILPLIIFLIIYLVLAGDSFFQFFSKKNILGYDIINFRVSSFFGNELILGSFILKTFPVLLYLAILLKDKLKKYFSRVIFFSILLATTISFLAGGRTSFFLLIIFLISLCLFLKNYRKLLLISYLFTTIAIIFVSQFDASKQLNHRLFVKPFYEGTNYIYSTKKENLTDNERQIVKNLRVFSNNHHNHYILALELFKKNFILGVGPKGFRYYCRSVEYNPKNGICSTHPHNYVFQILSELGIVGIIFYIFGLYFVIKNLLKTVNKNDNINLNDEKKSLFIISSIYVLIVFFPFSPSGNFFNNWISISNYYHIGFYLYFLNNYYDIGYKKV